MEAITLGNLKAPKGSRKRPKIIGRGIGSGHGRTATRGTKGQKARGRGKPRLGFEGGQTPLYRRIPKRGFKPPKRTIYQIINIKDITAKFTKDAHITKDSLYKASLIKKKHLPVKLLGKGEIDYPVTIEVDKVSDSAREKIEAVHGKISIL